MSILQDAKVTIATAAGKTQALRSQLMAMAYHLSTMNINDFESDSSVSAVQNLAVDARAVADALELALNQLSQVEGQINSVVTMAMVLIPDSERAYEMKQEYVDESEEQTQNRPFYRTGNRATGPNSDVG